MKAVLGLLFLLSGFTVGYLVLAGKLPNANAAPATTQPAATASNVGGTKAQPITINRLGILQHPTFGDAAAYRGV